MKQISEETLKAISAEVLGSDVYDGDVFMKYIDFITMLPDNVLEYIFKDDRTVRATWKDHSRSESWTDEKRRTAVEKRRKNQCREQ